MRFEFHPEALDEYQEAAQFYAARQEEIGQAFVESVEHAIAQIVESPTR